MPAEASPGPEGTMPVSARLRAVELYGGRVVPMVRDILASR